MKKLIEQIMKFGVVGVLCFLIDYGLMILLSGIPDIFGNLFLCVSDRKLYTEPDVRV